MYAKVFKFNPYHDGKGRFAKRQGDAFAGGAASQCASTRQAPVDVEALIDSTLNPSDAKELRQILKAQKEAICPPECSTKDAYSTIDSSGKRKYSKERIKVHHEIMDKYFEKYSRDSGNPSEVIFLGGLPEPREVFLRQERQEEPVGSV